MALLTLGSGWKEQGTAEESADGPMDLSTLGTGLRTNHKAEADWRYPRIKHMMVSSSPIKLKGKAYILIHLEQLTLAIGLQVNSMAKELRSGAMDRCTRACGSMG